MLSAIGRERVPLNTWPGPRRCRPGSGGAVLGSVPEMVAGYRLLRPLGTGGMGAVYEAEETTSGRRVALKLVTAEFAASNEAMDRFRQEGRLASMIVHPRCVFVLAADEHDGQPYIVMELMPGTTLQDLVQERGPLPLEEAIAKIADVIDGLQEAHQLGVIHRDVKPSNCFVETDGRVKIGDFGLAKSLVADQHLTKSGSFLGTPLYASPEQIKAERVDQQTDVYSVAATLYFLLTGRAPFQSRDSAATVARIVSDPPPTLRSIRPEIPPSLEKIVLRGLERHASAAGETFKNSRRRCFRLFPASSLLANRLCEQRPISLMSDCSGRSGRLRIRTSRTTYGRRPML